MGEKPTQIFRQKALDKLARPESLDDRIMIRTVKSWLLPMGFCALLLYGFVWGIWQSLPFCTKITALFTSVTHAFTQGI